MNPHSYRLKGRDFVHQGKIEIDVNERAVFLSELKAAFSFTPTPIVSLTVYRDDTTIIFAWKKEFDEKEKIIYHKSIIWNGKLNKTGRNIYNKIEKTGQNITNHIEKTGQNRYC